MGGEGLNDGGYRVWLRTLFAETWPDEDFICPRIHRYPKRLIESLALRKFADNPNEPSDVAFVQALSVCNFGNDLDNPVTVTSIAPAKLSNMM